MSLEVAEHISAASADIFVRNLTELSDLIVFSAAIPGQGGTFHVNEQWPEYWAEKFKRAGYVVVDCMRKEIWHNEQINFWYRQNILVFVSEKILAKFDVLKPYLITTDPAFLTRIHPELLEYKTAMVTKLLKPLGYWRMQGYLAKLWFRKQLKLRPNA
jgi:hypothetical protein